MAASATDVLIDAVRARGGRVTPQRLVILSHLAASPGHVTAEELHGAVQERLPGVSLPTVYATLELLEELGVVRRVAGAGGAVVFDSRTESHHHLACRRCGTVQDLDASVDAASAMRAAAGAGFDAESATLTVVGVCGRCAETAAPQGAPGRRAPRRRA